MDSLESHWLNFDLINGEGSVIKVVSVERNAKKKKKSQTTGNLLLELGVFAIKAMQHIIRNILTYAAHVLVT